MSTLRRLGCALYMPFISPFRSPFRPYNRAYAYRGLTAFAPLSITASEGNSSFTTNVVSNTFAISQKLLFRGIYN
ncbi:MAG: hypothetical protein KZQ60_01540 [Candidatus Thiodiazotropha sp. (ex Lucinoma aequizonata)]|nr:hypothetical protein [Candidatus Thiodiazotropha sp. (ex Lucinoma aequizonata)]